MMNAVVSNALAALAALALTTGPTAGQSEIPPPPPVPGHNLLLSLGEAEIIARLPQPQRDQYASQRDPRGRFHVLLDASDTLLDAAKAKFVADEEGAVNLLFLYQAVVVCADKNLRSPEAKVPPRDKLFKKFERRLAAQLGALKAFHAIVGLRDIGAATEVSDSVTKLRFAALNSALDVDPAVLRQEASQ